MARPRRAVILKVLRENSPQARTFKEAKRSGHRRHAGGRGYAGQRQGEEANPIVWM